jgi:hypothetical protein
MAPGQGMNGESHPLTLQNYGKSPCLMGFNGGLMVILWWFNGDFMVV